jgi:hypothetical protein
MNTWLDFNLLECLETRQASSALLVVSSFHNVKKTSSLVLSQKVTTTVPTFSISARLAKVRLNLRLGNLRSVPYFGDCGCSFQRFQVPRSLRISNSFPTLLSTAFISFRIQPS